MELLLQEERANKAVEPAEPSVQAGPPVVRERDGSASAGTVSVCGASLYVPDQESCVASATHFDDTLGELVTEKDHFEDCFPRLMLWYDR